MAIVYDRDGLKVLSSDSGESIKLICARQRFSVVVPAAWQFTRIFPSEAHEGDPLFDFGVLMDAAPKDPGAFTGVWFNRLPPQSEQFPAIFVVSQPLPEVSSEEFERRLRAHAAKTGAIVEWYEPEAELGNVPARDLVLAYPGRKFRSRLSTSTPRLAVFIADGEQRFDTFMEVFEEVADGVTLEEG